jgi:hypothetical protein
MPGLKEGCAGGVAERGNDRRASGQIPASPEPDLGLEKQLLKGAGPQAREALMTVPSRSDARSGIGSHDESDGADDPRRCHETQWALG